MTYENDKTPGRYKRVVKRGFNDVIYVIQGAVKKVPLTKNSYGLAPIAIFLFMYNTRLDC